MAANDSTPSAIVVNKDNEVDIGVDRGVKRKLDESECIQQPQKRAENQFADRQRHATLWYEDGTIILANKTTLFRVSREILARRSVLFKDMFSLPQPKELDSEETFDGLPVVVLDDSTQDLQHLLSAVFVES